MSCSLYSNFHWNTVLNPIWKQNFTCESKHFLVLTGRLRDWLVEHRRLTPFQVGFIKGRIMMYNIFIIKTIVDKYFTAKAGRIH